METDTTKDTAPAANLLAGLFNPEAFRKLVIDAVHSGNVKIQIPGETVKKLLGDQAKVAAELVAQNVAELAHELAKKIARNVEIKLPKRNPVILESPHAQTPDLIRVLETLRPGFRNVMLIGPAGSGKTTAADQAAKALGFEEASIQGQTLTRYEFDGFVDANGVYRDSTFRRFVENPDGGLFLQDEIDSCEPAALLGLNAYLANGRVTFPDGKTFKRSPRHYVVSAANTFGLGANRIYCGRNQLDAATLDRYRAMIWNYDEELEGKLVSNDAWHGRVKAVRKAVDALKLRHTVTPRDAIRGADEIAAGSTVDEQAVIQLRRGMSQVDWDKVSANLSA